MGVVVFVGIAATAIGLLFWENRVSTRDAAGRAGGGWSRKYVEERKER